MDIVEGGGGEVCIRLNTFGSQSRVQRFFFFFLIRYILNLSCLVVYTCIHYYMFIVGVKFDS